MPLREATPVTGVKRRITLPSVSRRRTGRPDAVPARHPGQRHVRRHGQPAAGPHHPGQHGASTSESSTVGRPTLEGVFRRRLPYDAGRRGRVSARADRRVGVPTPAAADTHRPGALTGRARRRPPTACAARSHRGSRARRGAGHLHDAADLEGRPRRDLRAVHDRQLPRADPRPAAAHRPTRAGPEARLRRAPVRRLRGAARGPAQRQRGRRGQRRLLRHPRHGCTARRRPGPAARHAARRVEDGWNTAFYLDRDGAWHIGQVITPAHDPAAPRAATSPTVNSPSVRKGEIGLYTERVGGQPRLPGRRRPASGASGWSSSGTAGWSRTAPRFPKYLQVRGQLLVGRDAGAHGARAAQEGQADHRRVRLSEQPRGRDHRQHPHPDQQQAADVDDREMHPRTAVGIDQDTGQILLLVIDGRQELQPRLHDGRAGQADARSSAPRTRSTSTAAAPRR